MIDKSFIGTTLAPHSVRADVARLRFFAKAIGETNPIYTDEVAARAAGHPGLPLPPTFLFCLDTDARNDETWLKDLGISYPRVLHAEQSFTYHRMAYVGDMLHFNSRIADMYDRRNGDLIFVVLETQVSNQQGEHVADLKTTIVERKTTIVESNNGKDSRVTDHGIIQFGETLPPLHLPPVDRTTLALYGGTVRWRFRRP